MTLLEDILQCSKKHLEHLHGRVEETEHERKRYTTNTISGPTKLLANRRARKICQKFKRRQKQETSDKKATMNREKENKKMVREKQKRFFLNRKPFLFLQEKSEKKGGGAYYKEEARKKCHTRT